ncbi:MAG: toll/interleukin-1 receptor domain-containing protein [Conexibacter sp.]
MDRGERLRLLKKTASRLAQDSWPDMELTLRTFEYSKDGVPWEDDYTFSLNVLERGTDAQLLELHRHFFPQEAEIARTAEPDVGHWEPGTFRLFISHTSAHKARAAKLREVLAPWGVDAFVAHDTIEPTLEWRNEIEAALRTCHALCTLLTTDFVESRWCDQEVGFAVARSILVLPVRIEVDPYGFIGKLQAIGLRKDETVGSVAGKLFQALARNPATAALIAPNVALRFENSPALGTTREMFALLQGLPHSAWTPAMMQQVDRASRDNVHVRQAALPGGRSVPDAVRDLIREVGGEPAGRSTADDDIPF